MDWKEQLVIDYPWLFTAPSWKIEEEGKRYPVYTDAYRDWETGLS